MFDPSHARWPGTPPLAMRFGRGSKGGPPMIRIFALAALVALLVTDATAALARGHGASAFSPGHQFRAHGSVVGHHGASGYAPGHSYLRQGSAPAPPAPPACAPSPRAAVQRAR